jgi:hypothetical protein
MAYGERLSPALAGPSIVETCWLCGTRQPADHMVPDGGSACSDVRWYCMDTHGCTERWTARWANPPSIRPGTGTNTRARARQLAEPEDTRAAEV